ncbi:hypothetical protein P0D71_05585 [Paraburkholderia sp. RL17-383-BIF-A]|jgi:hypothetical protein|nr:hypothetical protein [Burkholderia sp. WP9]
MLRLNRCTLDERMVFACFSDTMFARYEAELQRRQAPPSKPV